MTAVGMVQVPIHQVIDMVAMGHGLMAAIGAMLVGRFVTAALVRRGATLGVVSIYGQGVLFDLAIFLMVEVAIMQVIDMALVNDGGVSAGGTMLVVVIFVLVAHGNSLVGSILGTKRRQIGPL